MRLTTTNGQSLTIDASSTAGNLTALGLTAATTNPGANGDASRLTSLAAQFNDLRTQIQRAARDSGFNGINLLNNQSLGVQFNEDNTSKLDIFGLHYGSASVSLNVGQIASGVFDTSSINTVEGQLSSTLTRLRADASKLGSNLSTVQTRADFTRAMVKTLSEGADNLVLADQNEEGATLATLNIRQQLATTALSLASQAQQRTYCVSSDARHAPGSCQQPQPKATRRNAAGSQPRELPVLFCGPPVAGRRNGSASRRPRIRRLRCDTSAPYASLNTSLMALLTPPPICGPPPAT